MKIGETVRKSALLFLLFLTACTRVTVRTEWVTGLDPKDAPWASGEY